MNQQAATAYSDSAASMHALLALAEPNRFRIVELLRSGPLTVTSITEQLELRQPQTSKHLKVLREAGIVATTAERNHRVYSLRPEPFRNLDDWLQTFRGTMQQRFDNLAEYLQEIQGQDA